jgi:cytochrome o ubiquinol oxidase subunit III
MKNSHETYPDTHHDAYSKTLFGFWLYILTDFMMFGTFFATYAVLRNSTFGGPSGKELFDLNAALVQTLLMLAASFLIGLGSVAAHRKKKAWTILLHAVTFVIGCAFVAMQMKEFSHLLSQGHGWQQSAFLSAFFTLVGTYGLHMVFGLLWIVVLVVPVCLNGLNPVNVRRLTCLKMFWQFLNVVWVFIFTFVYLMGGK